MSSCWLMMSFSPLLVDTNELPFLNVNNWTSGLGLTLTCSTTAAARRRRLDLFKIVQRIQKYANWIISSSHTHMNINQRNEDCIVFVSILSLYQSGTACLYQVSKPTRLLCGVLGEKSLIITDTIKTILGCFCLLATELGKLIVAKLSSSDPNAWHGMACNRKEARQGGKRLPFQLVTWIFENFKLFLIVCVFLSFKPQSFLFL